MIQNKCQDKDQHGCLGEVTDICGLQALWVVFRKTATTPKTLSLSLWLAGNWAAKRLHAAICTVEEVYRIVSFLVPGVCGGGVIWLNIQGLWGMPLFVFLNQKQKRNVEGEMGERSFMCQSQIAAGRHRQEVPTSLGNAFWISTKDVLRKTHQQNYDYYVFNINKWNYTATFEKIGSVVPWSPLKCCQLTGSKFLFYQLS